MPRQRIHEVVNTGRGQFDIGERCALQADIQHNTQHATYGRRLTPFHLILAEQHSASGFLFLESVAGHRMSSNSSVC